MENERLSVSFPKTALWFLLFTNTIGLFAGYGYGRGEVEGGIYELNNEMPSPFGNIFEGMIRSGSIGLEIGYRLRD